MMASCHRRSGNYNKALETYKNIHKRFPDNIECLKFLVRLCTDLGMPEAKEYANKLKKAERVRELRDQRNSASSSQSTHSATLHSTAANKRPSSSRGSLRTASARINLTSGGGDGTYEVTNKSKVDTSYDDPLGPAPERPKTGMHRGKDDAADNFDDDEVGDDLLPD